MLEDGIPDAAYKPLTGDDKDTAKYYLKVNRDAKAGQGSLDLFGGKSRLPAVRPIATEYTGFRALSEDTIEDIVTKDRKFRNLRESSAFRKSEIACDLYIAAFLLPKVGTAPASRGARNIPTTSDVWQALDDGEVWGPLIGQNEVARRARAFHWPLEFPNIMQRGGFDVVLGNPPWERIKLQEQEFFGSLSPEIANAANKAARDKLIKALAIAPAGSLECGLHQAFISAKRDAEATSEFVRVPEVDGGRFALTGRGDVNTYALFAELFSELAQGRAGIIVPTGVATDATTAPFFTNLVKTNRLVSLFSFYEIRLIFTATDDRNSFCLLTLGRSDELPRFAFSILHPADTEDNRRVFELSAEQILAINPNTKTAPIFRSRADAELTAKIYQNSPVLINDSLQERGNLWDINFMTMFHMSNDSAIFRSHSELDEAGWNLEGNTWELDGKSFHPLYEAKMIHQFDHRWASYDQIGTTSRDATFEDKAQESWEPLPRYWVSEADANARLETKGWNMQWLMGWRDITNATAANSVIASVFPRKASNHKLPLFFCNGKEHIQHALLANLNSLSLDYAAKQKIAGTNLTYFYLKQFPILPPSFYTEPRLAFVTPKVLELTYTSEGLAPFARNLGHNGPPFAWDMERRANLRADLDAFYARAYSLTRDELRYILDPADVKGPDYPSETFRVLKEKEIRTHGEYRTRRLVLAAWDRMEADGTFAYLGLTDAVVSTNAPPSIVLPVFASLRDGAWAWPAQTQPQDRLSRAAQFALWLIDPVQDSPNTRFLVASLAEPALLTPLLSDEDRAHWIRLAGAEARSTQVVTRLRPPINAAWRTAFNTLISSGQLEESDSGDWIRGRHFINTGLNADSADAQRAMFALQAIRQVEQDQIAAAIAEEDNIVWARFGHGTG